MELEEMAREFNDKLEASGATATTERKANYEPDLFAVQDMATAQQEKKTKVVELEELNRELDLDLANEESTNSRFLFSLIRMFS
jgi:hypothetical protein